jgi:hypothetical protein
MLTHKLTFYEEGIHCISMYVRLPFLYKVVDVLDIEAFMERQEYPSVVTPAVSYYDPGEIQIINPYI